MRMNNKQCCFKVGTQSLYLDCVLVEFEGTPLFFICKDNSDKYYISLCYDIDELYYYVAECTNKSFVLDMIKGNISMRQAITMSKAIWDIGAKESIEDDIVRKINVGELRLEFLPEEDAYYQIVDEPVRNYVNNELDDKPIYRGLMTNIIRGEGDTKTIFEETIVSGYKLSKDNCLDIPLVYQKTTNLSLSKSVSEIVIEDKDLQYEIKEIQVA